MSFEKLDMCSSIITCGAAAVGACPCSPTFRWLHTAVWIPLAVRLPPARVLTCRTRVVGMAASDSAASAVTGSLETISFMTGARGVHAAAPHPSVLRSAMASVVEGEPTTHDGRKAQEACRGRTPAVFSVSPPSCGDDAVRAAFALPHDAPSTHAGAVAPYNGNIITPSSAPDSGPPPEPGSEASICTTATDGCGDYERLLRLAVEARDALLAESKVVLLVYLVGLARRRKRGLWPTLELVRNYVIFKVCYFLGLPQPTAALNALATKRRVDARASKASPKREGSSFMFDHSFSLSALR